MNVLVIGSGGREHALVWKLRQSPLAKEIYCAPGNPGTEQIAQNVDIGVDEHDRLIDFALQEKIDLTVIGPEMPLVDGLSDKMRDKGLAVFGPSQAAAQLEGSKSFAKELMRTNNIPTASYSTFDKIESAKSWVVANPKYPVVLKADGLAAGKGVLICKNKDEALEGVQRIMGDKDFGAAGNTLVIEEFLKGDEVSVFVITDGENYHILPPSQDHKRIGEGDSGENTGGMGAYAPAPLATDKLMAEVEKDIIKPTLRALRKMGRGYRGLLYVGLIVADGKAHVLEYNCRFGDPETQAVLPLVKSDLLPVFYAAATDKLGHDALEMEQFCSIDVVLSSGGYPGRYQKNKVIEGLEDVDRALVFHAGTRTADNHLLTAGGRVLNLVSLGGDFAECAQKVYGEIYKINFEGMYYRRDIAWKVLKPKNKTES